MQRSAAINAVCTNQAANVLFLFWFITCSCICHYPVLLCQGSTCTFTSFHLSLSLPWQVAFYGSPEKAIKFFMDAVENRNPESFQKLASEKYNPADLILDALNDEHNQECILEHYKLSPEPTKIMNRVKAAKIRHETQSVLGS